ncbi:MAG: hypothetical protein H0T88_01840 [Lysobacter sp.]|nr:hypothetical protein [Lysobacter sp.]
MRAHMKQAVTAAALIVAASMTACSDDPQAANESNFKAAIQAYLDTQLLCVEVPLADLPGEAPEGGLHQPELDALTQVGLLEAQSASVVRRQRTGADTQVPGYRYTVTGKGAEFLSDTRSVYSGRPQLCAGKPTVTRIVRFSEASGPEPVNTSQVVYAYQYRQVPDWATDARMTRNFTKLRYASAGEQEGSMQLMLAGPGWKSALMTDQ